MHNSQNSFISAGLKFCLPILILTFLCACAASHHNLQEPAEIAAMDFSGDVRKKIDMLQHDLTALNDGVDLGEARRLAETSISYSLFLADEYRLVRPPYLHNILVRIGLKERGLCYQWTEDLMNRLTLLELKSFHLHEGVAHKGSELREHNSVVVTAKGQEFSEGIVLDPWRDSGNLYWALVKTDRYKWEKR